MKSKMITTSPKMIPTNQKKVATNPKIKTVNHSEVVEVLGKRKKELEIVLEQSIQGLQNAPEGALHTIEKNSGSSFQYYIRKASGKETYIRKNNMDLVTRLASKKYLTKTKNSALEELKDINKYLEKCSDDNIVKAYESLHKGEQILIEPFVVDDATYREQWESIEYQGLKFSDDLPIYHTDKGERVRSKSEILIANMLKKYNIPYRYEFPLRLENGLTVHPDFTILDVRKRKNLYWEHLGMMDDLEYIRNATRKIDSYEDSGLFPGRDLILSHETLKNPLTPKAIEGIIRAYI